MQEDAKAKESQSRSSTHPMSDYASPVAPFSTDASVSEVIAHGLNALDRSDFDQAILIFEAVSGACPEVPLFHAVHALALFQNGKIPEALRALLRAEKLDSTNERVLEVAKVLAPWQSTTIAPAAQYASEHPSTSVVHQCEFSAPGLSSSFPKAYEISGLSMHGPLGLIVGERQKLLLETAVDGNIDLAILPLARDKLALNAPTTRPGRFMPLYGVWSEGFFHWMVEWLPKVIVAQRLGFDGTYIIPARRLFIRESLRMLGIPDNRIEEFNGESWSPERALIVPLGNSNEILSRNKPILHALRHAFRNSAEVGHLPHSDRIYISRNNPERPRRVVNEPDLSKLLMEYEVDVVDMESLSLARQVGKVVGASFLMGPSGAGIVHAGFMQERGVLVELFPPNYINPVGMTAADLLNLRYFMVPSYLNGSSYQYGGNIEAFLQPIEYILRRELEGIQR